GEAVWRRIRAQTCWTTWPQPIPCLSAIQWHARKISSQPEKDMDEMQYIMSGVVSAGSGILQWRRIRAQTCWTTWPQPILCPSAFRWHARKISRQPEKDTNEVQYIMSGVANVADWDEQIPTCGSGLWLFQSYYYLGAGILHPTSNIINCGIYIHVPG
uniref:Envelope glycoprotein n=1 Tax=Mesocestoides corti TaxID=53468 RepID=A0A5K3G547_MESCO